MWRGLEHSFRVVRGPRWDPVWTSHKPSGAQVGGRQRPYLSLDRTNGLAPAYGIHCELYSTYPPDAPLLVFLISSTALARYRTVTRSRICLIFSVLLFMGLLLCTSGNSSLVLTSSFQNGAISLFPRLAVIRTLRLLIRWPRAHLEQTTVNVEHTFGIFKHPLTRWVGLMCVCACVTWAFATSCPRIWCPIPRLNTLPNCKGIYSFMVHIAFLCLPPIQQSCFKFTNYLRLGEYGDPAGPASFHFTIHGPLTYTGESWWLVLTSYSKWCSLSVSALSDNPNPAITHPMA